MRDEAGRIAEFRERASDAKALLEELAKLAPEGSL
jgi:hypothetical protein